MDGTDRGSDASKDVLEHGSEPGRLAQWSRSRIVRGAATCLLVLAASSWFFGPAGPDGAGESAATAASEGLRTPAAMPRQGGRAGIIEGDHECESQTGPAARSGRPAGLASARSHRLVGAVRRFARTPRAGADVPWAPRVLVLAEGPFDVNRSVSAAAAGRRATWTNPSYVLAGLAAARPGRLRIDDLHHVTCRGTPRQQAAGFENHEWVSVQPRVEARNCLGWWAIDLYLDGQNRIEAVLVRS